MKTSKSETVGLSHTIERKYTLDDAGLLTLYIDDRVDYSYRCLVLLKPVGVGKVGDLQNADSIIVDEAGFRQMWPGEPLSTGKVLEMNDCRAVVVGVYRGSQTFMTMPVVYTRFS